MSAAFLFIPNGYDYSASKISTWLKWLYLAATNRKISSRVSIYVHWHPGSEDVDRNNLTEFALLKYAVEVFGYKPNILCPDDNNTTETDIPWPRYPGIREKSFLKYELKGIMCANVLARLASHCA
jgi:hypothetical protein